jgi:hypothetical protein
MRWLLPFAACIILGMQGDPPGAIQGVVVRAGTSEPLPRVAITVAPRATDAQTTAFHEHKGGNEIAILRLAHDGRTVLQPELEREPIVTDSQGRFVIEGLPPGIYGVMATREGFFGRGTDPETPSIYDGAALSDMVIVQVAGSRRTPLTMELIPGASISGRVVTREGNPVVGHEVRGLRAHRQGDSTVLKGVNVTRTDDRGEYRLHTLPPGEYFIAAGPPGPENESDSGVASTLPPGKNTPVWTFYPATTDPELTTAILLEGGEEFQNKDIRINHAPVIRISGEIFVDVDVQDVIFRPVNLLPRAGAWRVVVGGVQGTDPALAAGGVSRSGAFSIVGAFPPGLYELRAIVDTRSGQRVTGSQEIRIGEQDVSGVRISVKTGR